MKGTHCVIAAMMLALFGCRGEERSALQKRVDELVPKFEQEVGCEFDPSPVVLESTRDDLVPILAAGAQRGHAHIVEGRRGAALAEYSRERAEVMSIAVAGMLDRDTGNIHICLENFRRIGLEPSEQVLDLLKALPEQGVDWPLLEVVLVHELAHLHQYQHLSARRLGSHPESLSEAAARAAVVEGHAEWLTQRVAKRIGMEDIWTRYARGLSIHHRPNRGGRPYMYAGGQRFVQEVVDALGSEAGVRRLFEDPPPTLEDIERPHLYLEGRSRPWTHDATVQRLERWLELDYRITDSHPVPLSVVRARMDGVDAVLADRAYEAVREAHQLMAMHTGYLESGRFVRLLVTAGPSQAATVQQALLSAAQHVEPSETEQPRRRAPVESEEATVGTARGWFVRSGVRWLPGFGKANSTHHELILRLGNLVLSVLAIDPCDAEQGARRTARRVLAIVEPGSVSSKSGDPPWPERWRQVREPGADPAVLLAGLKDGDPDVRRSAFLGLARRGGLSDPHFQQALDDPDWEVRWAVMRIRAIDKTRSDEDRAEVLKRALSDPHPAVIAYACIELKRRSYRFDHLVPWDALRRALFHADVQVRRRAFELLGARHVPYRLGRTYADDGSFTLDERPPHQPEPPEMLAVLRFGLADDDPAVRMSTAAYLARCAGPVPSALRLYVKALTHEDLDTRRAAASEVRRARLDATAIPALIEIAGDSRFEQRDQIISALVDLRAEEALPALRDLLGEEDLRLDAGRAIQTICGDPEPLLDVVREDLGSENVDSRGYVISLINEMGPAAEEFVPRLIELLGSSDAQERLRTVNALRRIGAGAEPALDALDRMAEDEDKKVRRAASDAARAIRVLAAKVSPHSG